MATQTLLTRTEVARMLNVHPNTVDAYRKSGRLTYVELGIGTIRFRQSDVDALVAMNLKKNVAPELTVNA